MTKEQRFKFIDNLDTSKLPITKGKKVDGFRFYDIEGKAYPSITTVLSIRSKEGIEKWRNSIGEKVANWEMGRAARRGKATHTLVEQYIKNETPSIRDVLPLGLFRLLKPYIDQIDNIHCLETIMYSKQLTIAGQVDCIAEYNGKLSVIDFKNSKTKNEKKIGLKTTSYKQLLMQLCMKKCLVNQLNKLLFYLLLKMVLYNHILEIRKNTQIN